MRVSAAQRRSLEVVTLAGADRPPGLSEALGGVRVRYADAAELAAALPGVPVLFVWDFRSDALRSAWSAAGDLRWVHAASAGVDPLLFDELLASGVVLTNSRGVFDEPMAEYVLALVLAFAKDLPATVRWQEQRRWRHRETERVTGARALVVGTGPIGRAVGRRLRAAGLRVAGAGRTARPDDPDLGTVHASAELPAALAEADYVVLAAPLTEQTRGLIDAAALAAMKPTARLVNVGRGPLVVTDDLVAALAAGRIAGAALDVFPDEPLPTDSPLWTMPQVIVSPHMSGDVVGWREELVDLFADNLQRWRHDQPLRNVVDKARGYVTGAPS
jgi:phosphoglycerate dehydrogenase-like enzyme